MGFSEIARRSVAAGLVGLAGAAGTALTRDKPEGYPQRPIDLVVVYPAGGGMDAARDSLAEAVKKTYGRFG